MRTATRHRAMSALLALFLMGCPGDDVKDTDTGDTDTDVDTSSICPEPEDVACVDALIVDLGLHDDRTSEGEVTNSQDGDDWVTIVDATAGGFQNAAQNAWTYVRFTENGAERVDIDDESALESTEWHIAAKRFILRVNSGSSGPSCVGVSPFLETAYTDLNEVPDAINWYQDDYYTPDCTIINDSSGLPGSPQVALGAWWEYPGCVATTSNPFLVQLDSGEVLKLVVEQYYAEGQDTCNNAPHAPGNQSALYTWRWRFIQ